MTLQAGKSSTALALNLHREGGPAWSQVPAIYRKLVSWLPTTGSRRPEACQTRKDLTGSDFVWLMWAPLKSTPGDQAAATFAGKLERHGP